MAFSDSNLTCIGTTIGSGGSQWKYASTDAHTDVDATDYFSTAKTRGMKAGDIVTVYDSDAPTGTVHIVTAIDSDGNGTIAAATLS